MAQFFLFFKKERTKSYLKIKGKKESKITVVDSIMGSGKTSWSIQHINNGLSENFLYITPFLDEVERIIKHTRREFYQPINKGDGKLTAINELLAYQEDIASTHELFKHLDEESTLQWGITRLFLMRY